MTHPTATCPTSTRAQTTPLHRRSEDSYPPADTENLSPRIPSPDPPQPPIGATYETQQS
jgi:hypothetical protein